MRTLLHLALTAAILIATTPAQAANPDTDGRSANFNPAAKPVPTGAFGLVITTEVPRARALFDAGLIAYWASDAAAALHAFRAAQAADPSCAMCHWGEALALGPRPHMPMPAVHVRPAWNAILRAEAVAENLGPLERDLISALRHRYGVNPMVLREGLDHAWVIAVEHVAAGFGQTDLLRLLLAEAQAVLRTQYPGAGG